MQQAPNESNFVSDLVSIRQPSIEPDLISAVSSSQQASTERAVIPVMPPMQQQLVEPKCESVESKILI